MAFQFTGDGVYLGGEQRAIYTIGSSPHSTIKMPVLYTDEIKPGDRVTYTAMWKETNPDTEKGYYLAVHVAKKEADLPMKVFLTEHGPTVSGCFAGQPYEAACFRFESLRSE